MAEILQLNLPSPERRSSNPAPVNPAPTMTWEWVYGHLDTSDIRVTPHSIKQIAAAAAALRLITSSLRSLPLYVINRKSQKREAGHPVTKLLTYAPNDEQTIDQLLAATTEAALTHGAGFLEVTRSNGVPDGLWFLNPATVSPVRLPNDSLVWQCTEGGKVRQLKPWRDIIVISGATSQWDGISPVGPLHHSHDVLAKALAVQRFTQNYFRNYATPQLALMTKKMVKPEDKVKMRESWQQLQSGSNQHKLAVIDADSELRPIGNNLDEASVVALSEFSAREVASLFGCDLAMLGSSAASSTNASLVQTGLHFVKFCLAPWIRALENGLSRGLLSEDYAVVMDTHSLMRMTPVEAAATVKQAGVLRVREARLLGFGLEPLGDERDEVVLSQVNMADLNDLPEAQGAGGASDV
jgi:HK97 family phage portal protein